METPEFKFYIPVEVRYSDLDPQWHVNNTRYVTFMEQARLEYLRHLGLFEGQNFLDLKMIIADVHVAFLAPILLEQNVRVARAQPGSAIRASPSSTASRTRTMAACWLPAR
jgi:acyl-CoA thioester hydrolase